MRNKLREMKGITLIALVITIIVLLILVGVSIATLTGDNGILTKANDAKIAQVHAEVKEAMELQYIEYQLYLNAPKESAYQEKELARIATTQEVVKVADTNTVTTFKAFLLGRGIIDSEGVINVKKLVNRKLSLGNGTTTDIYKLEVQDGKTSVNYYDEKGSLVEKIWSIESEIEEDVEDSASGIELTDDYGHSYVVEEAGKYYFYSHTYGQNFMSVFNVTEVNGKLQANKLGEYSMETGRTISDVTGGNNWTDSNLTCFADAICLSSDDELINTWNPNDYMALGCVSPIMGWPGSTGPNYGLFYRLAPGFYYHYANGGSSGEGYKTYIVNAYFELIEYEQFTTELKNMDAYDLGNGCGNESGNTEYYRGWVDLDQLAVTTAIY